MNRTNEVQAQADRISLEQFIEASSSAVLRALDARRPPADGQGIGLPTATIGIVIRPSEPASLERALLAAPAHGAVPPSDQTMATARASAEIHSAFVRRLRRQFAALNGDRLALAVQALDGLQSRQLLASWEVEGFKSLLKEAARPQARPAAIADSIARLNEQMRTRPASPLGLTLAGVVTEGPADEEALPAGERQPPTVQGDKAKACVSEGLVGAILGAELAGGTAGVVLPVVGAVPGAVVGAVVGGAIGCAAGILASVL